MKKRMYVLLACLLSAVLAFSLVGCGGSLTISDESLALTVGDTKQLTLKSGDEDVTDSAEWTTEDQKIVTVSSRGNVSAKAPGTAKVTGTYEGKSATCTVSVTAKEVVEVKITDESGTEITSASVDRGATITLKATTSNDSDVTWSSGDTAYATVAPVSGQKNTATVTGVFPTTTPVKIYAKSGSTQVGVDLTVNKPADNPTWYDMVARDDDGNPVEGAGSVGQNKSPLGKWTFWRDQAGWNNGNADMGTAEYLGDSADSMAGSIHLSYTNGMPSTNAGCKAPDTVQITFRSPTTKLANKDATPEPNEGGLLENGKYYKLTFDLTVDFDGIVTVNGTEITLTKGVNHVTVYFQHNDDGAIRTRANGYFNPAVEGDSDYDIYQFPAFYMAMGSYEENTFVPKADITIAKLQWTESQAPGALKAPTVAVSDGKVTVSDTANAEGVKNYTVGFFKNADDATPAYAITANKGEATSVDTSRWNNGDYVVKAKANPADGRFLESAWSAAADGKLTVANETVEYALKNIAAADLGNDQWAYWSEGAGTITDAKYKDGVITLKVTGLNDNWYSNQVFYKNSALKAGGSYTLTCVISTTKAGRITLNATVIALEVGDNDIEVTFTEDKAPGKASFSLQFGVQEGNAREIEDADITIKEVNWEVTGGSQPQPQPGTPTTPANPEDYQLGEKMNAQFTLQNENKEAYIVRNDSQENKFAVWHTAENGWDGCGTIVTMNETKIENNALTISYTGGSVGFSVQLYYNNPSVTAGKQYFLSMKINASELYTITINGVSYTLAKGDNNVALVFTKGDSAAMQALDIQFPGHETQLTFVISDVAWQEVTGSTQPDTETLGEAINAKYTAVRKGAEKKGDNDTDGADVSPNVWILWWRDWDPAVTMNDGYAIENNVLTFSFSGGPTDGEASWATQLFYNNTELTQGKTYRLFMKINSSAAYTITVNGAPVALVAGDNDVNVKFTLGNGLSAVDIQFPSPDAHTIKISDVYWKEVNPTGGQPETPAGATQMTKVSSAAEATEAGKWYYYAKDGVTVTKAEVAADGTITFVYSGATAWDDVKIFYTPADVPDGEQRTILLTIKFDYEGEPGALTISLNSNDSNCPGYSRGQEFTGQGFRFTKNAGSPMFQMTLGKEGVANPQGQVTLTLKVENVAP